MHYLDENGKWVDIDNSLTLSGNEYSTNNKSAIKFANKSGSNGLLSIKDGDYKIDLTPLDTNKVSVEIENPQENNSRKFDDVKKLSNLVSKATYKNIYDGIDLEYILTGNNVKENIIVNSKQESYIYTFELKLNKLNAELVDNSIALYDSDTGEKMYVIPAPYMYDSEGELSQEVEYTLTKNNKWKYTLTVEASKEWINSEERSFPVTIDPTIVADTDVIDNFFTVDNDANANLQYLMIGNFMNYYMDMPAFFKFNTLPTLPGDSVVTEAKLALYISYVDNPDDIDFRIGVYEATADWTNSISWENINNYYNANRIFDEQTITTIGTYEWDITSLYEKWQTQNYGLCAKGIELTENTANARINITSYEGTEGHVPQLEISYRNGNIEKYYAYANNTLGSYGESYVNLYNGSLTYINHLTTISKKNLIYDINMVYNSIEKAWKPSFSETIKETTKNYNGETYVQYIWHDSEYTQHNFVPNTLIAEPTEYYPEDDIDYVLTKTTNNEFILKDYQGNQRLFDENGRLLRICDVQGNVLHFSYVSEKLSLIDYKTYDNEFMTQVRLTYDASGNIKTIYNFATQLEISFNWSGTKITKIMYNYKDSPTHKEIDFTYYSVSGILGLVMDSTDEIYIEYAKDENNRINRIQEYMQIDGRYLIQSQNNINYNAESTICIDLSTDLTLNTDDDIQTKYTFDSKGRKTTLSVCYGTGSEFTLTNTYSYNGDILPDDIYYTIAYHSNIYNELYVDESEANIVRYDIGIAQEQFLNFSNLPTTSTTANITSNVEENYINDSDEMVSPAHIIGDDNRTPVQNIEQYPYSAICYVRIFFAGKTNPDRGTGFLIGSNILLTAGHNLVNGDDAFDFPQRIEIYPGGHEDDDGQITSPYGMIEVETCYIQKEYYDYGTVEYDWGVCVLESDIGCQTGWFDMSIASDTMLNEEVIVTGFPSDVDTNMYTSSGTVVTMNEYRLYHNVDTEGGNSGSPVYLPNNVVIGIHTSGNSTVNGATRINLLIYTFAMNLKANE